MVEKVDMINTKQATATTYYRMNSLNDRWMTPLKAI